MRVLIDSSSLYSALLHDGRVAEVVDEILTTHDVVLTDYILEEIRRNLEETLGSTDDVDALLTSDRELHELDLDGIHIVAPRDCTG